MCGIAGILRFDKPINIDEITRFTDSMSHRGPDGSGYEIFDEVNLAFGHRRLSILDLTESGKQPMTYADNRFWITFNGEIYNFLEIRRELENQGIKFVSDTDTEVILASYAIWGKDCLNKFNGMWALAIYDTSNKSIFIARDRFGIKPLHYSWINKQHFAFASETIAFKFLNNFQRTVNPENLNLALKNPSVIEGAGWTIFNDIWQLLPGHYGVFNIQAQSLEIKRWWNTADNLLSVNRSYAVQVDEFKSIFENACKIRMRSDVPLASALSGGLDSSSVYCTLQKFAKNSDELTRVPSDWRRAFVATFPNTSVDERKYAEEVIKYTDGDVRYIEPDYSNLVSQIVRSTRLFDSIISTPIISISPIYKAMRDNNITVSLDGHGVDEMMYGYDHYVLTAFWDAVNERNYDLADDFAEILQGVNPKYSAEKLKSVYKRKSLFKRITNRLKTKKEESIIENQLTGSDNWFNTTNHHPEFNTYTNIGSGSEKLLFDDFHYFSLPVNLRDFDRASMQHSIEIRMPFMDYRLVSYVFSLPISSKLGNGYTKRILRDSMKGTLPESIRNRKNKIGIGAPMVEWFNGALKEYVLDSVNSELFIKSPYWNGHEISKYINNRYLLENWDKSSCNKVWSIINANIIIGENEC